MIRPLVNAAVNVIVLLPVLPQDPDVWFTSTLKRISVHIRELSVEPKNGTALTKYGQLLKETFSISNKISVLPAGVHRMKKLYMLT